MGDFNFRVEGNLDEIEREIQEQNFNSLLKKD
jgi:hypothetical protein